MVATLPNRLRTCLQLADIDPNKLKILKDAFDYSLAFSN